MIKNQEDEFIHYYSSKKHGLRVFKALCTGHYLRPKDVDPHKMISWNARFQSNYFTTSIRAVTCPKCAEKLIESLEEKTTYLKQIVEKEAVCPSDGSPST